MVHDAFLALWRAPEAFDATRGAFRTFFLALVHHRAVDTIRREERIRARRTGQRTSSPSRTKTSERVVDEDFPHRRRREVREALADLSRRATQVLEMAYFGGRTQVRIAEELGIPLGTVKTRTFAALRKLRAAHSAADDVEETGTPRGYRRPGGYDRIDELLAGYALRSLSGEDAAEADRVLSEHVPAATRCRETLAGVQRHGAPTSPSPSTRWRRPRPCSPASIASWSRTSARHRAGGWRWRQASP